MGGIEGFSARGLNMRVALIIGVAGILALVIRARRSRNEESFNLVGFLVAVWSVGLLLTGFVAHFLDYSTEGLLLTIIPLAIVLALSWQHWFTGEVSTRPHPPDSFSRRLLLLTTFATLVLLVYDVVSLVGIVRKVGPTLALAQARVARQSETYYPAALILLNPLRMLTAPMGWAVLKSATSKRWRVVGVLALIVGLISTMMTTGRSTFIVTLLWLWGISYYYNRDSWGIKGTLRRVCSIGVVGAAFFVVYGIAIGKTGVGLSRYIAPQHETDTLWSTFVSLVVYVTGPIAALANSATVVLSQDYTRNIVYPITRILHLMGLGNGAISRSLPYLNIPFPFNTYTFLGPAYWFGGLAGGIVYSICVLWLLIGIDRVRSRKVSVPAAVLSGFLTASVVMSLFSDYFFTAGFAYVVYCYYLLSKLVKHGA